MTGPSAELGEGAAFSLLYLGRGDTTYSADFAVIWESTRPTDYGRTSIGAQAYVEGSFSSDKDENANALRAAVGLVFDTSFLNASGLRGDSPIDGLFTTLGVKYETDQDLDTRKLMVEALVTPTAVRAGIGQRVRLGAFSVRWRPYVVVDVGRHSPSGLRGVRRGDPADRAPHSRRLFLDFVERALGLPEVKLYVDNDFFILPLEKDIPTRNFFVAGLVFAITEAISFGVTYKNGQPMRRCSTTSIR